MPTGLAFPETTTSTTSSTTPSTPVPTVATHLSTAEPSSTSVATTSPYLPDYVCVNAGDIPNAQGHPSLGCSNVAICSVDAPTTHVDVSIIIIIIIEITMESLSEKNNCLQNLRSNLITHWRNTSTIYPRELFQLWRV